MLLARLALTILDPSVQSLAHLDALAYVSSTRQIGGDLSRATQQHGGPP